MRILASQYITTKKVDKPFTLIQCECLLEYEHLFRHAPGARAQVRLHMSKHILLVIIK